MASVEIALVATDSRQHGVVFLYCGLMLMSQWNPAPSVHFDAPDLVTGLHRRPLASAALVAAAIVSCETLDLRSYRPADAAMVCPTCAFVSMVMSSSRVVNGSDGLHCSLNIQSEWHRRGGLHRGLLHGAPSPHRLARCAAHSAYPPRVRPDACAESLPISLPSCATVALRVVFDDVVGHPVRVVKCDLSLCGGTGALSSSAAVCPPPARGASEVHATNFITPSCSSRMPRSCLWSPLPA